MNVIIHDTMYEDMDDEDIIIQLQKLKHRHCCSGCFGCWIKTPGICVINDDLQFAAYTLGEAEQFIIISEITYGGYSFDVKQFLDRSLGYIQPYFTKRGEEMHHVSRYAARLDLIVIGYGAKSEREKDVFRKLAAANALNMNAEGQAYVVDDEAAAWKLYRQFKEGISK